MIAAATFLLLLVQPEDEAAQRALDVPTVAEEPPEPDDDCDDPQDQQRMNFCASLEFGAAEAELNEQWELTAGAMRRLDEKDDGESDTWPAYYETAAAAQRAWLAYRDAECAADSLAGVMSGRSVQVTLELQCRTYLTQLRIEALRALASLQ